MKVKKLNVDGGREYKGQLTLILKSLGIKYEPTPPRTPECNRKVERVNRTLNNRIRAMIAQANTMPNSFWAPAMKATAYLRNRLPRSALDDEIPYRECNRSGRPTFPGSSRPGFHQVGLSLTWRFRFNFDPGRVRSGVFNISVGPV
jgi:hypothetical protein